MKFGASVFERYEPSLYEIILPWLPLAMLLLTVTIAVVYAIGVAKNKRVRADLENKLAEAKIRRAELIAASEDFSTED